MTKFDFVAIHYYSSPPKKWFEEEEAKRQSVLRQIEAEEQRILDADKTRILGDGEQWFEVWQEGWTEGVTNGAGARARYCGRFPARTFEEACKRAKDGGFTSDWHGKFVDNEADARRRFG